MTALSVLLEPWTDPARWRRLRGTSLYLDEQVREVMKLRDLLTQLPDHAGGQESLRVRNQFAGEAGRALEVMRVELLEIDRRVKAEAPVLLGEVPIPGLAYSVLNTPPTEAECEEYARQMRKALGLVLARTHSSDDNVPMSAANLAKEIGRPVQAVRVFLTRYARIRPDCRIKTPSRRRKESVFSYRRADVLPALRQHFAA